MIEIEDDEREITPEENNTITANNKYLVTDARFKPRYDATDILISGNIPELKDDAERFVCTNEIGRFVQANGINGAETNIAKLFSVLKDTHLVMFLELMDANQMGKLISHPDTKTYIERIVKLYE